MHAQKISCKQSKKKKREQQVRVRACSSACAPLFLLLFFLAFFLLRPVFADRKFSGFIAFEAQAFASSFHAYVIALPN